jgi:hypothetical protein
VLGQVAADAMWNEITAVPKFLKAFSLDGRILTVGALNWPREIAQQVIDQYGDYVMACMGNEEALHGDMRAFPDDPRNFAMNVGRLTLYHPVPQPSNSSLRFVDIRCREEPVSVTLICGVRHDRPHPAHVGTDTLCRHDRQ